jgi:hypothetical protein
MAFLIELSPEESVILSDERSEESKDLQLLLGERRSAQIYLTHPSRVLCERDKNARG